MSALNGKRQELVAAAARDEIELKRALADLKRAVRRPFEVGEQVRERFGAHPLPFLLGSVLVGVWLGSRRD